MKTYVYKWWLCNKFYKDRRLKTIIAVHKSIDNNNILKKITNSGIIKEIVAVLFLHGIFNFVFKVIKKSSSNSFLFDNIVEFSLYLNKEVKDFIDFS